jgi:hypothetical protein
MAVLKIKNLLIVMIIILLAIASARAQDTLKVLFLGNSQLGIIK